MAASTTTKATQPAPGKDTHKKALESSLQSQNEFLAALHQITLDLFKHQDLDELLQSVVQRATSLLDAPYGELMLKEGDELVVRTFTPNQPFLAGDRVKRADASLSWQAHDTGKPAVIADYMTWAKRRPLYDGLKLGAVADFPIMRNEECIGVLGIARSQPDYPFSAIDIQRGELFSQMIALVLNNFCLYDTATKEIAERKQTEAALRESEERYRSVITTMREGIVLLDADGVIRTCNPSAERILGLTADQMMGLTPIDPHWRAIHENGEDFPGETHPSMVALHTGQPQHNVIMGIRKPDDSLTWISINAQPMFREDEEKPYAALVSFNDINNLKLTEAALEMMVEQLTALTRLDKGLSEKLDTNYIGQLALETAVEFSQADAGFIGIVEHYEGRILHAIGNYSPALELHMVKSIVSRTMRTMQPELISDVHADPDYHADIPETRAQMTIPLIARHGVIGVLNLETASPEKFTVSQFDFLRLMMSRVAIALDNALLHETTQTQLEEMRRLYARVSELEQLKTDMIRVAAHDLRNPLSITYGYYQLLKEDDSDSKEKRQEWIEAIGRGLVRMEKMINDILSLERIEATQSHIEQVNLCELVANIGQELKPQAVEKQQQLVLNLPDEPLTSHVDAAQIGEAVQNLIGNAIKYTPMGGFITVNLQRQKNMLSFEVQDTGYGIPEDMQARLFQPFYRAKTRETNRIEGTGLGLHLVKNIVERHGGKMRFKSVYHQGSTFAFDLPLAASHVDYDE
jgi:PAS domain S-box-containing protein